MNADFDAPTGLTAKGRKAAMIIREHCSKFGAVSGHGGAVLQNPQEFCGEDLGDAVLVVIHEGSDADPILSMDGAYYSGIGYEYYEALVDDLHAIGVYLEQTNGAVSVVWPAS